MCTDSVSCNFTEFISSNSPLMESLIYLSIYASIYIYIYLQTQTILLSPFLFVHLFFCSLTLKFPVLHRIKAVRVNI